MTWLYNYMFLLNVLASLNIVNLWTNLAFHYDEPNNMLVWHITTYFISFFQNNNEAASGAVSDRILYDTGFYPVWGGGGGREREGEGFLQFL